MFLQSFDPAIVTFATIKVLLIDLRRTVIAEGFS